MMVLTNFSSHDFLLKDVNSANHLEQDDAKLKGIVKNTNYFSEKSELESSFVKSTEGWTLVLRGLLHQDNLTRKRALYLLKRLVEHLNLDTNLFHKFFLVLETVDEKQVHIVKQVFGHINNLWKITDLMPFNLVILRQLFKHQNQGKDFVFRLNSILITVTLSKHMAKDKPC